jgi:tetratricopeptide (TPR) repeat protein
LTLAADHARAIYANADAIRLYREAIAQVNQILLALTSEGARWSDKLVDLQQALGDLLLLGGDPAAARGAFAVSVANLPYTNNLLRRAGLLRRIGKTHEVQHRHEEALRAYSEAEAALAEQPRTTDDDAAKQWWTEWFNIQTDRIMVYYWLANDAQIESVIGRIQAAPMNQGSASQQAQIFKSLAYLSMRRERYALSAQTVSYARRRLSASVEWGDSGEILEARFMHGMSLLFHGKLDAGRQEFIEALPDSERRGDMTLHSRFLAYLTVAWRRAQDVGRTRESALQCLEVAQSSSISEYIGVARANLGWVAWREGSLAQARTDCAAALGSWASISFVYPFQWMARFVLLALDAEEGLLDKVAQQANGILDSKQELLPTDLATALSQASERRRDRLQSTIALAQAHGFL